MNTSHEHIVVSEVHCENLDNQVRKLPAKHGRFVSYYRAIEKPSMKHDFVFGGLAIPARFLLAIDRNHVLVIGAVVKHCLTFNSLFSPIACKGHF